MLFYITMITVPLGVAFISAMSGRDEKRFRAFVGLAIGAIIAFMIFGAVIPGIATGVSDKFGVRYSTPVDGEIRTVVEGVDDLTYQFESNGVPKSLDSYGLDIVFDNSVTNARIDHICDETPDWAVPYTIGSCHDRLYLPQLTAPSK